jgi:CheY-like chemotaxis protein
VVEAHPRAQAELDGPLPSGSERVLFVDDEKSLADIGKEMLERFGYRVTPRTSSVEALELLKAKPDEFDLVITDMTMPNMSGFELTKEIITLRPDMPIILCTGFSETITEASAKAAGIRAFLMKPVTLDDLTRTVREVLDPEARSD